ncbi:MAG: hypothetical protein EA355_04790 [Rhodobacteraceae bacterium]|nr:MAG: hypothetical protein EA355_04790 [Paracoccaceae bacterium]
MALLRVLRRTVSWALVAALLVTNVLTLTWGAFNAMLSGAFAAVGVTTVAARQAQALAGYGARKAAVAARMGGRVARGAARSAASIAPQSVPVVGAGVVLAVTAWELYDWCKLAEDIETLSAPPPGGEGIEDAPLADQGLAACGRQIVSPDALAAVRDAVPEGVRARHADLFATLDDADPALAGARR